MRTHLPLILAVTAVMLIGLVTLPLGFGQVEITPVEPERSVIVTGDPAGTEPQSAGAVEPSASDFRYGFWTGAVLVFLFLWPTSDRRRRTA